MGTEEQNTAWEQTEPRPVSLAHTEPSNSIYICQVGMIQGTYTHPSFCLQQKSTPRGKFLEFLHITDMTGKDFANMLGRVAEQYGLLVPSICSQCYDNCTKGVRTIVLGGKSSCILCILLSSQPKSCTCTVLLGKKFLFSRVSKLKWKRWWLKRKRQSSSRKRCG